MKRLLYLEDLYNFYVSQNKNVKFSSKDSDTSIVIHIDEPLTFDSDSADDLIMKCPIRLCHTEDNVNRSTISKKSMEDAIPTAYNMPVLGYIYKDENEEFQFAGHEFFINNDNEIEYEEIPVGTIPESAKLQLVYDEDMDKTYLDGTSVIWKIYSKAADIIEREKQLSCSVEIVVDELSYDSKNKLLVIDKFRFSGVTILGKDRYTGEEIKPGMQGANISLSDFSENKNSVFSSNEKVIELLSALNEKIDNLNINEILKEGGNDQSMKKVFDENPEIDEAEVKETPSATFDGEDNGEEPDFYDNENGEEGGDGDPADPPADDPTDPPTEDPVDPPADDPTDPPADDDDDDDDSDDDSDDDDDDDPSGIPLGQRDDDDTAGETKKNGVEYSVKCGDIEKQYFATLTEKLQALSDLVNITYGETDGTWYYVDADEENKTVYMHDMWADKHFRQSYSVKKDVYTLKGDRVETFARYLTQDEINQLEQMKSNYSTAVEELAQFKAEPEKLEILNSEEYSQIRDTEEYKNLSNKETYFAMDKDELVEKLDACLLEYAKHNEMKFSSSANEKSIDVKRFGIMSDDTDILNARYGGIFN